MNTMKETPTKMVFLMTAGDKFCKPEVMAYMPEENYNITGTTKMCYMHNGQHGPCSEAYALDCKPASFKQYRPLLQELKLQVGYTITVLDAAVWKKSNGKRRIELKELDRSIMEVPKRSEDMQKIVDELNKKVKIPSTAKKVA